MYYNVCVVMVVAVRGGFISSLFFKEVLIHG